jgi:AraC-like DNA-binding protein
MATNTDLAALPHLGARERSEIDRCAAVEKVIAAMHERIDRPFSLDEMARIAYLSRFYFNRIFREVTGLPPVRFQTALRIDAAKRLLATTDLSVTEVCLEVGYQSLGTFTTHFHELVGASPREFRRYALDGGRVPEDLAAAFATVQHGGRTPTAPVVEGEVVGVPPEEMVFVGLFRHPYPQGVPLGCTALMGSGHYRLHSHVRGLFHVVAAVPGTGEDATRVAATRRPVLVASGRTSRRDLRLRAARATDPPILLALPTSQDRNGPEPMPSAWCADR